MPFTPFHMGPGLLLKALMQGSFSLMIFGWTQVLMDIQPLAVLITGEGHLHGFSHTFIGSTLISVFAAVSGKPVIEKLASKGVLRLTLFEKELLGFSGNLRWSVVVLSSLIGGYSHVYLDAIMHGDVEPFYPLSVNNPYLGSVSVEQLHQLCSIAGLVGVALYFGIQWFLRRA